MTDVADGSAPANTPRRGRRMLLILALAALLGGGGFASTFLGFWSPRMLLAPPQAVPESPVTTSHFVDLPQIVLTLAGPDLRTLMMSIKIETDAAHEAEVRHLTPRLLDAFNAFLVDVDSTAFGRRGILDIIRGELATRAVFVLGKDAFTDLLITEFRIQ